MPLPPYPPSSDTPDFRWNPIIYFYTIYILVLLAGGIMGVRLSTYGGVLFLLLLYGSYWQNLLRTKIDITTYCILLSLLIPIIPLASYDEKTFFSTIHEFLKYQTLHMVLLLYIAMPATPLNQAKRRGILFFAIIIFLVIGLLWEISNGYRGPRFQGFHPNPNGFAMTSLMLLFLIDSESKLFRIGSHILVIAFLLLSRTSGALLGYFCGFTYLCFFTKIKNRIMGVFVICIALSFFVILYTYLPKGSIPPVDNTLEKIILVGENIDKVMQGKKIDYYSIVEKRGKDFTSGLWRLSHWYQILSLFFNSSPEKFFFGHGIGTTDVLFKLKPHNDYLRLLFETGAVGFIFNIAVWIILYLRMDYRHRWIVITVAVFCLTENNYDHFPAMSLLALFMISNSKSSRLNI